MINKNRSEKSGDFSERFLRNDQKKLTKQNPSYFSEKTLKKTQNKTDLRISRKAF